MRLLLLRHRLDVDYYCVVYVLVRCRHLRLVPEYDLDGYAWSLLLESAGELRVKCHHRSVRAIKRCNCFVISRLLGFVDDSVKALVLLCNAREYRICGQSGSRESNGFLV
jgi:hypothetical protein